MALGRRGIETTVLERAAELTDVGAGIQITPNGVAVLGALGIAESVRDQALVAKAVELRRAEDDRLVARMGLADRDWLLVHRALLIEALGAAARAEGARIETSTAVGAVTDDADAARLVTGDTRREVPLVVGADGVRGGVRAALGESEPVRFTGQVAWRALVPGGGPAVAEVHMAPGRHVVTYPLAGGLRNIVAVETRRGWAEEGWSIAGDADLMRSRFGGVSARLAEMLGEVREVHVWGLHRHPVARRWYGQRVVLVGDTLHPTLPFLAQGANMALEDAWALADCLGSFPLDQALPAYQARRRERAARIVAASGGNAWIYHMWRGPQRWALHQGIGAAERIAPGGAISRFDWIYDHDETCVVSEA